MTEFKKVKTAKKIVPSAAQKKKWWQMFYGILGVTLILDFFTKPGAYFGIDGTPFFYAWYGFVSCLAIIVVSKTLGIFLKRPDDYYSGDDG